MNMTLALNITYFFDAQKMSSVTDIHSHTQERIFICQDTVTLIRLQSMPVFLNLFLYAEPFWSKKFSAEPLNQSDFIGGTPKTKNWHKCWTNVWFDSFSPNIKAIITMFPTKMYKKVWKRVKKLSFWNYDNGCGTLDASPRNPRALRNPGWETLVYAMKAQYLRVMINCSKFVCSKKLVDTIFQLLDIIRANDKKSENWSTIKNNLPYVYFEQFHL